jgi:HAD superfamily hydrolase (TIGR01549 family)
MIKAVFFDFYNTLVDYDPPREQLQVEACREAGIEVTAEAIRRAIPAADEFFYLENARLPASKRPEEGKMELYAEHEARLLEGVGLKVPREVVREVLSKLGVVMRQSQARFVLFPDVEPALAQLKGRGLALGVITNIDYDLMPTCQELGLTAYLDFLVTSLEVGAVKPDAAIFRAALERAGVVASEALHVGDQYLVDIAGARAAGIGPLLIDRDGLFPDADCPRITSISEVVGYV